MRNSRLFKWGALTLALILPVAGICIFASPIDSIFIDIIYYVLWCGFYGSILCMIIFKRVGIVKKAKPICKKNGFG